MKVRKVFLATSLTVVLGLGTLATLSGKLTEGRYKAIGLFSQVLSLVRSSYVEEVPLEKLEEGAINGLVASADPQGTWVPAAHAERFRAYHQRTLPPFGLVLAMRSSYPVVLEVLPGSAAAEAGVRPGELIERIGDQPVRARPLWQAFTALEQAERQGEAVAVDVIAHDLSGKRPVRLQAGKPGDPSPQVTIRDGIAVVRLPVVAPFYVARLASLLPSPNYPVVVDLRGTALGSPEGAVEAAGVLLGGELRLPFAARGGQAQPITASRPPTGRKVVVCVDHTTARAGEWLAYLLHQKGVPTVGVETFGDTGLRAPTAVANGELWVAHHFLLNTEQKPILGRGLKPTTLVRPSVEGDAILDKALELVRGEEKAKAA